jgi:glycine hydroxymethyltransferase
MADVFSAAGVRLIAGGTSNHLILADVFGSLNVTGADAEKVLDEVGITVNKNVIADDPRKPLDPSGIRFGTPAITTRKFMEKECARVAELMLEVLQNPTDAALKTRVKGEIVELAKAFPVPDEFL